MWQVYLYQGRSARGLQQINSKPELNRTLLIRSSGVLRQEERPNCTFCKV